MRKQIEQVDLETGEIIGRMVWIPYRPKLTERWFMAFQDAFEAIAKDPDMTGENLRVLMYLYSKLDFENFIQQGQTDIATALGMRKQHVSRAIRLLTSKQIVLEGPRLGRSKCFRLNPDYGWKGKVKTLQEVRRERFRVIRNETIEDARPPARNKTDEE